MKRSENCVVILLQTAEESERIRRVLESATVQCVVAPTVSGLCEEISRGAGAALISERGFLGGAGSELVEFLGGQPPWSDFPLVVIADDADCEDDRFRETLNTTWIDRPIKVRSLLSVLRAAVRSRQHQYAVRDHLESNSRTESDRARLAAIVETSDDAIVSKSLDGIILTWNSGAERLFGYKSEEVVGKPITIIIPSERRSEEQEILSRLRNRQRIEHFETVRTAKDGRQINISLTISPILGRDGNVIGASKVARDITEKKRNELELYRTMERVRLLWEAASTLLMTESPDAMMQDLFHKVAPNMGLDCYFNFMVSETQDSLYLQSCLGISDSEARSLYRLEFGQAICGTVAETRCPMVEMFIQSSENPKVQLVKGIGIRAYVCHPLIANGRLLGTLSFASRIRDTFDSDELEFLCTVCRYVTVAYERLRLVKELRDGDRKKDDFIALLAHELRNPLAPIRNAVQIMKISGEELARAKQAQEIMDRQLTHMVRLIDDLLDISRIGRNKMELRRECVTLEEVISAAVETAQPAIDSSNHELNISLPQEPIHLHADLTRLAQVFSNLLTNSAKYTPLNGKIWVKGERQGDWLSLSVRDNGIGIPKTSLPAIFDMFSQVDRSIERTTGGLGIGLALVKGLANMHDGTVTAESDDRGSTFTVRLPILEYAPISKAFSPKLEPTNGSALRILVVDDNRDGAESLSQMLTILGNEVETANDGVQAVERAEKFLPDVILMDVGMPRLNGYEATRQIRQQPWSQRMLIYALTGWGQEGDRKLSEEAGCNGHLVKPVSLPDLEAKLVLARKSAPSSAINQQDATP